MLTVKHVRNRTETTIPVYRVVNHLPKEDESGRLDLLDGSGAIINSYDYRSDYTGTKSGSTTQTSVYVMNEAGYTVSSYKFEEI